MELIEISGQTDVGLRRKDNQDTFICQRIDSPKWPSRQLVLLAAIDGVGGYAGGEQAAAIARTYIESYMAEPKGDILSMLREAIVNANNQILEARQQDLRVAQMSCVLTVAVADADRQRLYFIHVGDTRLYRFRNGVLDKLSLDHSLVGVREDAGDINELDAMNHPRRNEILRDVGSTYHQIDDTDFFDVVETDFLPGDLVLLCSDGLTDMLTRAQITALLNQKTALPARVQSLIDLANQQGGKDNITVVVAQNMSTTNPPSRPAPKKQTGTFNPPVAQPTVPVNHTTDDRPMAKPKSTEKPARSNTVAWVVTGLVLVLAAVAGFIWYNQPSPPTAEPAYPSTQDQANTEKGPANFLDSLRQAAPNGRVVLSTDSLPDTLRLLRPILVTDTLDLTVTGAPLVCLRADSSRAFPAFQVAKNGLLLLDGLHIQGFDVAIQTAENVHIKLKNVTFQQVSVRVAAQLPSTDTTSNEEIIFSAKPIIPKKPIKK